MRRSNSCAAALAIAGLLFAGAACSSDSPSSDATTPGAPASTPATAGTDSAPAESTSASSVPVESTSGSTGGSAPTGGQAESDFFVRADYERELAQRDIEPTGSADTPWLQAIEPEFVDTTEFVKEGANTLCFSNASVSNPWRVTGFITMQQQVEVLQESGDIGEFRVSDAADDDNKQISDIQAFVAAGDCDAIIISPSTTATLTPAVEAACESGVPVIVFDRGVNTDCMVTFIHPIGGYAFGASGAEFLVDNLEPGSNVLALRILPGVDVLENRWAAAQEIFGASDLNVLGNEFTGGDAAQIKDIVTQYLQRGDVDGIWMDAGDGAVAALEAFEDAGVDYPVFMGEDELSFMRKWEETGITAIAAVYSNFQWRTPIVAATMIWKGEEVPAEWVLPQQPILEDELADYLERNADMPSLHYAKFGGEDLPGYPEVWSDR
jgi:ribose transport system substrate-binding protein